MQRGPAVRVLREAEGFRGGGPRSPEAAERGLRAVCSWFGYISKVIQPASAFPLCSKRAAMAGALVAAEHVPCLGVIPGTLIALGLAAILTRRDQAAGG